MSKEIGAVPPFIALLAKIQRLNRCSPLRPTTVDARASAAGPADLLSAARHEFAIKGFAGTRIDER